jgi:subtilisin family serine protease
VKRALARVAYTQSYVVACLHFDEVVQVLLPLTDWWRTYVWPQDFRDEDHDDREDTLLRQLVGGLDREKLARALAEWSRSQVPEDFPRDPASRSGERHQPVFSEHLLWMVRIIGTIEWARRLNGGPGEATEATEPAEAAEPAEPAAKPYRLDRDGRIESLPRDAAGETDFRAIVDAACDLLEVDLPVVQSPQAALFLINRNRQATAAAAEDNRRAIKADAAANLFDIRCDKLIWAVIDSGIDASHDAFLLPDERAKEADGAGKEADGAEKKAAGAEKEAVSAEKEAADGEKEAAADEEPDWPRRTRVVRTYDFTRLRPLLDQEVVRELVNAEVILDQRFGEAELDAQLEPIRLLLDGDPAFRRQLDELGKRISRGREIDWELLDPLLRVPHDRTYPVPVSGHGTHVAGILAADWKDEEMYGVCRDIRLYDLRVLDPYGPNDEFTVLAALQFVQYLNRQQEMLTVQGANLSLSIKHEVTNYACGRTPVCDECERLVASGVVVVAAGGNAGWDAELARAAAGAGYRTVSITDPGNAEAVITVGATHRDRPHTYGVSFFSSRGPTGDGRSKPDLVAPGEKITSTIPGGRSKREDGTSMAAPHVSGAAALLMARHQELVGQPRRIKEILCRTATDLGRERHFQGAGMLDVLRALQSV